MKNSQNTDSNKIDNTPESVKSKTGRNRSDNNKNISSKYSLSKQSKIIIKKQIKKLKLKIKKEKEVNRQKDAKLKEENLQNNLNNSIINMQTEKREKAQTNHKLIVEQASNLDNKKSESLIIKPNKKDKDKVIDNTDK